MNRRKLLTFILITVSTIFLYGSVVGQAPSQRTDIAEISNNGSNVSWLIKVPNEGGMLKVSTPSGEVFQREFESGSVINFSPTNERGEYYGNGQYTYELVLTPVLSPEVKEVMERSRMDGNSDAVAGDLRKQGMLPKEMIESGTFTFINGTLITGNKLDREAETPVQRVKPNVGPSTKTEQNNVTPNSPEDQQILDDLIVVGSACVGQDCVNGENFGFDTLRLKENNLRIKFEDTSNSASFPSNDWELTANDSSNGGANRFSITDITAGRAPFTVEAGAPANSLYVDDGGKIGIKTSTPVVGIHQRDGNTPTLRLEQDGSSGFTAQTWDIAGNEANFFIRDATNGSRLPFKIRPGAASDSFVIEANGDITIKNNLRVAGTLSASYFPGSAGQIDPADIANATVDANTSGVGPTPNVAATVNVRFNVQPTPNLSNTSLNNIEYTIRYVDNDGASNTDARVRLQAFSVDVTNGAVVTDLVFDSNTSSATTENTVTVCKAVPASQFDFANRGMFLKAIIQNKTASGQSKLIMVKVIRKASC